MFFLTQTHFTLVKFGTTFLCQITGIRVFLRYIVSIFRLFIENIDERVGVVEPPDNEFELLFVRLDEHAMPASDQAGVRSSSCITSQIMCQHCTNVTHQNPSTGLAPSHLLWRSVSPDVSATLGTFALDSLSLSPLEAEKV